MRNTSKKAIQFLGKRSASASKITCLNVIGIAAFAALLYPPLVSATPLLGSDLAGFTVLGASKVSNVPISTIAGNVGVWSSGGANSITGFLSTPGAAVADPQLTGGLILTGNTVAQSAQAQLSTAIINLGSLGPGTTLSFADLAGLTLSPGVYTVPAGTTNLSGALTLDGRGNANAAWVFQLPSTLITSPGSVVNMINAGSGTGLFWNVGSSATIDSNTKFLGNILAVTSITMNTTATDLCGRSLASTGAVTLDNNTLSGSCMETLAGSNDLSGGLDIITSLDGSTKVAFLSSAPAMAPVPEAGTFALLGLGMFGLAIFGKRHMKNMKSYPEPVLSTAENTDVS